MPPAVNQLYIARYAKLIKHIRNNAFRQYVMTGKLGTGIVHRIIPKSLGGSQNARSNTILVNHRQQYLLRWMLWKAYQTRASCIAFAHMFDDVNDYTPRQSLSKSSTIYHSLKKFMEVIFSDIRRTRIERFGEEKAREINRKISDSKIGIKRDDTTKEKIRTALTGRKMAVDKKAEALAKRKATIALKPKLTCPRCGREGLSESNAVRWHFDNCKKAPPKSIDDASD